MVKRLAIVGLLLAVLVAGPFSSASTDSFEAACADAHLWLSTAIPPGLLEFMCAVYEGGSPVTVESGDESVLFQQDLRIDTDRHPPPNYPKPPRHECRQTSVHNRKKPLLERATASLPLPCLFTTQDQPPRLASSSSIISLNVS